MWAVLFTLVVVSTSAIKDSEVEASIVPSGYSVLNFTTYIDHFSGYSQMFNLRYYINTNYWNSTSGPIFFYVGGDGPIEDFLANTLYVDQLGQQLQALVVYAEHRYFGDSLPYGNKSYTIPQNLKYLSPHQAMADYAYLITYLKTQYNDAPVIAFGIRYGGMLTAWMRMTYSNLVQGAIASSAPIMHFNGTSDPNQAYGIVTRTYSQVAPECPAYIATAFDYLGYLFNNESEYQRLQDTFQTCTPISSPDDMSALFTWAQTAFTVMSVFNYPYPSAFSLPIPANPVTAACKEFNGVNFQDMWEVLEATSRAVNIYYNSTGLNPCASTYNVYANGNFGNGKGWSYLTCTSLNMPYGSIKTNSMFGDLPWDQEEFNNYCLLTWGRSPQVNYANQWYGTSINPALVLRYASNIVFSNGSMDPWMAGGITTSIGNSINAFVMNGAASGQDLMAPSVYDPPQVTIGRAAEKSLIQYWLYAPN